MINHITIVAGARPNFMKIAPIIHELSKTNIKYNLVHTGQHYDKKMSGDFFKELDIPEPTINLQVGSGTQSEQTAAIMIKFEEFLINNSTDLVLVVGDVTSTMACAIVAKKLNIEVAHVEAGIRSGDMTMPEEINRIVTDSITDYFFTTSEIATSILKAVNVSDDSIFFVGNTMIDTLLKNQHKFKQPQIWNTLNLSNQQYIVITLHRPSNVDDPIQLKLLLDEIVNNSHGLPIIFPVHPRTSKIIQSLDIQYDNLYTTDPLSYLEFNYLVKHSKLVITDSGGITEETTVMNIPCMTLRNNTERPETVIYGTNELVGTNPNNIKTYMNVLFNGNWKTGSIPYKWDGCTSKRIVEILEKL
jgi:UDP-N-acetylglucosamine 2-epimerase (non-hydrolysing)